MGKLKKESNLFCEKNDIIKNSFTSSLVFDN